MSASPPSGFVSPSEPRTPKSATTRRLLLDTAASLFIEHGFAAVSMTDIGAAAGLTKGALYGHFRSKGQLLVEVIRCELAEHDDHRHSAEREHGPAALFVTPGSWRLRLLEVDAAAAARYDTDVAAGLRSLYQERHQQIRDAVAQTGDPEVTAWLIAALAGGVGMKEAVGMPPPDVARVAIAIQAAMTALIPTEQD